MAIPRKNSRTISVDGLEYRWLLSINRDAPFYRIVTIAVELASSPGTKLIVYPIGVDINHVDYNRGEPFTPMVIAQFIRSACDAGWKPTDCSVTFLLGDQHADSFMNSPASGTQFLTSTTSFERTEGDETFGGEC